MFTVTEKIADTFVSVTNVGGTGAQWDLVFDIKDRKCDFVVFYFELTKDAASKFNFQAAFEPHDSLTEDDLEGEFYKETFLDSSSCEPYNPEHTEDGKYRVIIPVSQTSTKIKLSIVPDVETGDDTLVCHMEENVTKGNR